MSKNYSWEAIVNLMDDEKREQVHAELAPCTTAEFYKRYCELDPEFAENIRISFSSEMLAAAGIDLDA